MRATVRAHSLDVSTSSAATIQSGPFLARLDPGKMANLALRAPRYSASGRRPPEPAEPAAGALVAAALAGSVFIPICESSPGSKERCTRDRSALEELTVTPRSPASL